MMANWESYRDQGRTIETCIGVAAVLAAAVFSFIFAGNSATKAMQREAVERGLGEWRVNPETLGVEFHWVASVKGGTVELRREAKP